ERKVGNAKANQDGQQARPKPVRRKKAKPKSPAVAPCSPRQILLAIRREMYGTPRRGQWRYEERLRQARVERRERTSAKASRDWPRRKPHEPPKPPQLRVLDDEKKAVLA